VLRNGLEPWHLLIVAIVVIVLFGSKKLPDTARALGRSMRILKSEAQAMKDESASATDPAATDAAATAAMATAAATAPAEPSAVAPSQ